MPKIHINLTPAKVGRMGHHQALRWHREDYRCEPKLEGKRCFLAVQENGQTEARLFIRGSFRPLPGKSEPPPWHHELAGSLFDGVLTPDQHLWLFDCLCLCGRDIRHLALRQRRAALQSVADFLPYAASIIEQAETAGPFAGGRFVWKDMDASYGKSNWFTSEPGK